MSEEQEVRDFLTKELGARPPFDKSPDLMTKLFFGLHVTEQAMTWGYLIEALRQIRHRQIQHIDELIAKAQGHHKFSLNGKPRIIT